MVFVRATKTAIKRLLTSLFFVFAIILATTVIVSNAVSARTGMDIPVEVNWSDQNPSSRPSSVTLRLMNGTTEVSNITLTSSNVDPSDSNKWVGVFASVPQSINYTIVEDNVSGYTISNNNVSPTIDATSAVLDIHTGSDRNGTVALGDANFVLIKSSVNNNRWYLWTLENYSGTKLTQLVNAFKTATGDNSVSISTSYYSNDLPETFNIYSFFGLNETVTISGSEGDISYDHSYIWTDRVSAFYYGNVAPATSSTITITNTLQSNPTVSYQFTGTTQPPNASQLLPASAQYAPGATVTVAQNPTASGYRFLGWKINGSDAGTSFTMPSSDVTITGSWEQFNGYFTPTISKRVTSSQDVYRFGDTVEFLVTVSNTESYPITNVEVTEGLSGARFIAASGYTVSNSGDVATIATIPANGTVVLYAEYDITDDVTQTGRTNTVEITAASASNYYYLDTSHSITASASFDTQSWQDVPVLTGVDVSSSTTLLYYFLLVLGASGIVGGVVVNQKNKEREK